jgi:hypothetical protein
MSKVDYSPELKDEFCSFYALTYGLRKIKEEIQLDIARGDERSELFLSYMNLYGTLYEKPYDQLLKEILLKNPDWAQQLLTGDSANPACEVIKRTEEVLSGDRDHEFKQGPGDFLPAEIESRIAAIFAIDGNFRSLGMFGVYLSELVEKAKESDAALFKAVLVDVAVQEIPFVSSRVKKAELVGDLEFLNEFTKSIKKSKARRHSDSDDLRLMLAVVEERCGLENLTDDELLDLFVDELELLVKEEKDPLAALKWHISERKKFSRS